MCWHVCYSMCCLKKLYETQEFFYKSVQFLTYAYDLDLISRVVVDHKGAFWSLVQAAEGMGFKINDNKTKYMVTGKSTISSSMISIGDVMMEIKARLGAANKCCFSLRKPLSSKLLSREVTLIRPVLTYDSKTRTMGKHGENLLRSFGRKFIWKISGLVLENGFWKRRKNSETCKLYDEQGVKFIKICNLKYNFIDTNFYTLW